MNEPLAVLEYARGTPGRENEMPRVISCNWLPDGRYPVYQAPGLVDVLALQTRVEAADAKLAACQIALDMAWKSNRERDAAAAAPGGAVQAFDDWVERWAMSGDCEVMRELRAALAALQPPANE